MKINEVTKRKEKDIEHEEIYRTADETRDDRTERETTQHNFKHHLKYNTYTMTIIQSTMEN